MRLFRRCQKSGNASTTTTKRISGTFLSITQDCSDCLFKFKWDSQPVINKIPAGNLLLSAAILYSGSLPAKVIRLLKRYGCKSISRNTFFIHQQTILQSSVFTVWKQHQAELFKELHKENGPITLGDGRADRPGHSAKFGSYTFMELKKKVVIDVKLVQVCYQAAI